MLRKLLVGVSVVACMFTAGLWFAPASASAASAANCTGSSANFVGFPTWYKYLVSGFDGTNCNLNTDADGDGRTDWDRVIPAVLLAIFEIILRAAGFIAVIFVIYGGFQYLTSTGEPDKAKNGRTTIFNALVGLMVAMFATVIVNLVGRNIAP